MGMAELHFLAPEIFMLSMICVVLLVDLFLTEKSRFITYCLAQLTLIGAFYFTIQLFGASSQVILSGAYVVDDLSHILKLAVYILSFTAFIYANVYLKDKDILKGEYYTLGLSAVLGMMVLVSSSHLLSLYLGLELLSLSLYAMVAMQRGAPQASEAAMKYFIMGAIASGMLLYGMSMIYGVTGQLEVEAIRQQLAEPGQANTVAIFGLIFIVSGMGFKLGAVPFHMWIPDVYQGAPTSVTALISSAPKVAAFGMFVRLFMDALPDLLDAWQNMLIILAVLSISIGNVIAIAQNNIKRLLAYSAIAHMGYFLLGLLTGTDAGMAASLFYILVYALMSLGAFGLLIALDKQNVEIQEIDDLKGVAKSNPWFAFMMLILMFSMAGVPPTVGFYAKFAVLKAVVDVELTWLAGVAVFFAIIGAFYYLRVVKTMFFDEPEESFSLCASSSMKAALSVNASIALVLGIFPSSLMLLCHQII